MGRNSAPEYCDAGRARRLPDPTLARCARVWNGSGRGEPWASGKSGTVASRASAGQVAYEAHIAGMIYGFLITIVLLMTNLLPRDGTDLISIFRKNRTQLTP